MPINAKRYSYRDPVEDEYIFNCLCSFPKERMHLLTPRELKILYKEREIKKFVNHGSHDAKKILMAKGGFHFVSIYINENLDPEIDKLFDRKYLNSPNNEKRELINHLINKKMFAISSRELLDQMYLISQNCHTPYFFINMNYSKGLENIDMVRTKQLANFKDKTDTQLLLEAYKGRQSIAALILTAFHSDHYVKTALQISMLELHILLFMYYYKDTYVYLSAIVKQFHQYSAKNISNLTFKLKDENYITLGKQFREARNYTITELGILTVNEYLEKVTSKADIL